MQRLPQQGETCQAMQFSTEAGGKGLNVAVGLARLKQQVSSLIGCGNDAAADALFRLLQQEGIDPRFVYRFDAPSGQGGGFIDQQGHNMIAVALGANLLLTRQHAICCSAAIAQAGLVYGQFETAMPALEQVFLIAAQNGVPTLLNPSPWQQPSLSIQHSTHTLLLNEVEIQGLLPALQQDWQAVAIQPAEQQKPQYTQLMQPYLAGLFATWTTLHCLIVTLGSAGCIAFQKQSDASLQCWMVDACRVQALDTVGAGDAFAAGYAAALLEQLPFGEALQRASACAAYMVSRCGVLDALPTPEQLAQLMQHIQPPALRQIKV